MNEYLKDSMSATGAVMTGPLTLYGPPLQPQQAATKQYVDGVLGQGGNVNSSVTISTTNPYLRLRSLGANENRTVEAISADGFTRWVMTLADNAPLSGGNAGANFSLARYSDLGVLIDYPLSILRSTGQVLTQGRPILTTGGGLTLNGGFNFTAYQQPNGSFTPDPFKGNYQYMSNVGAFTISAPTNDCAIDILISNGAGAGAITMSGYTYGLNTGDLHTTTNGHRFIFSIRRIAGVSTYVIKALQ